MLTPRELEVLRLVAAGQNSREIAGALFLSPLTAKTHVSRILTKLNARDRVQLVLTWPATHLAIWVRWSVPVPNAPSAGRVAMVIARGVP